MVLMIIYWICKMMMEILRKQSQVIPLILGRLSANIYCWPQEDLVKNGWKDHYPSTTNKINKYLSKQGWVISLSPSNPHSPSSSVNFKGLTPQYRTDLPNLLCQPHLLLHFSTSNANLTIFCFIEEDKLYISSNTDQIPSYKTSSNCQILWLYLLFQLKYCSNNWTVHLFPKA